MKTLTMSEFKNSIGAVRHEIGQHGESFTLTYQGKAVARVLPVEEDTVVHSDGSVSGVMPITFRWPDLLRN